MGETVTGSVLLEIAVCSPDEAEAAVNAGADRLELSCALECGGLTPTPALVRAVCARVQVPVFALLRSRGGGFVYSDSELRQMADDARDILNAGASGIVFGCLTPHGSIAREQCAELLQIAREQAVFHRAFDFLTDRERGLQTLIDLGFTRVLTSGGTASAEAGSPTLAALVAQAANRIEVLPCGRVRASNVGSLVRNTGCNQVHAAPRRPVADLSLSVNPALADSMGTTTTIDRDAVRELRKQLDELQLR